MQILSRTSFSWVDRRIDPGMRRVQVVVKLKQFAEPCCHRAVKAAPHSAEYLGNAALNPGAV